MTRAAAWLIATLIAAAALVGFAPAALLNARVVSISGGAVRLADAEGTWWRGHGVMSAYDGSWRVPLAWRVDPVPLLRGTFRVAIAPPSVDVSAPHATVEVADAGVLARDVVVALPPAALASAFGSHALRAGGTVELISDTLEVGDTVRGTAAIEWRDARVATPLGLLDLGTVSAKLAPRSDALAGPLTNRGGDARLSGELAIGRRQSSVTVQLALEPNAPERARRMLSAMGSARSDGLVMLRFQTPPR